MIEQFTYKTFKEKTLKKPFSRRDFWLWNLDKALSASLSLQHRACLRSYHTSRDANETDNVLVTKISIAYFSLPSVRSCPVNSDVKTWAF